VSGDIASYTSDADVRFYNFVTGHDLAVPRGADFSDRLSDVSNGSVVFARENSLTGDSRIMVYDTSTNATSDVDPQPGFLLRLNPAIGGNTVAFIDQLLASGGEILASDLSPGGTTVRLTNDLRFDSQPQVSPTGDLIVWMSCATTGTLTCDIRKATRSGSGWAVADVTLNSDSDQNPDSDGHLIAFDSTRSGDRDIYWQSAGGGPEQRLELPGQQRNPSVSGGVIVFESVAPGESTGDVFAYQVSTNRMFQVVSTQSFDEHLNDVTALGSGRFRIVWTNGTATERSVLGADFEFPDTGQFEFGGFVQPVDPYPTSNTMRAGAAVPVKFSLGGFRGLDIFAAGYPKSQTIPCGSAALEAGIEQTVAAGNSSLSYDAASELYSYVWKTDRSWAGSCRQLVVQFTDGSLQYANFKFK